MTVAKSVTAPKIKKQSQAKEIFKRFIRNRSAVVGLIILAILLFAIIIGPHLTGYTATKIDIRSRLQFPSAKHWFGTDDNGRDLLTRCLVGGRWSLGCGILATIISAGGGIILGSLTGYLGGKFDMVVMRLLDIIQSIPGLLLTIVISAALGTGFDKTILALALGGIAGYTRMMRSSIMRVRDEEFLEAAEAVGCSKIQRIFGQALPNSMAPMIVSTTQGVADRILGLASLSYIGLGIQPPDPEWGALLNSGKQYIRTYPYLIILPGVMIAITVLSLNLMGDGLRDALDPKLKD